MKRAKKKENSNGGLLASLRSVRINKKIYFILMSIILVLAVGVSAAVTIGMTPKNVDEIEEESSIAEVDLKREGKINVLLLGVDVEGLRTDAIMIASYDVQSDKVNLLSIPRDTRMYIGTRYQKINAAHAIGGMKGEIAGPEGSVEAVTRLTGIPIHYYIEFSFTAIDNFIDALGGVDFEVPDIEGNGKGMNYDDPVQNLHIHLTPGQQHLTGNQVQQLLRYRKSNTKGVGYADGDRGRVEMQQNFVKELVKQKLTPSLILKVPDLYDQLKQDIKTNLTLSDITKYAGYMTNFKSENITAYQLPGENNGTDYGASYWICDLEKTAELVETVFGYDASKITIDSADGSSKSKDKKQTTTTSSSKTTKDDVPDNDDDKYTPLKQANKTPTPTAKAKASVSPSASNSPSSSNKPSGSESPNPSSSSKPNTSAKPSTSPSGDKNVTDDEKATTSEPSETGKNSGSEHSAGTSTTSEGKDTSEKNETSSEEKSAEE